MPTWPKNSKASTNNVDQGSDQISQARADILQNITNVNTIIDTFDIQPDSAGQPANGDLLQYNSATATWQPVSSSGLQAIPKAVIKMDAGNIGKTSGIRYTDQSTITVLSDANNLISGVTGDSGTDNFFTLTAGTYLIKTQFLAKAGAASNSSITVEIQGQDSAGAGGNLVGRIKTSASLSQPDENTFLREINTQVVTIATSRQYEHEILYENYAETQNLCSTVTTFEKLS